MGFPGKSMGPDPSEPVEHLCVDGTPFFQRGVWNIGWAWIGNAAFRTAQLNSAYLGIYPKGDQKEALSSVFVGPWRFYFCQTPYLALARAKPKLARSMPKPMGSRSHLNRAMGQWVCGSVFAGLVPPFIWWLCRETKRNTHHFEGFDW